MESVDDVTKLASKSVSWVAQVPVPYNYSICFQLREQEMCCQFDGMLGQRAVAIACLCVTQPSGNSDIEGNCLNALASWAIRLSLNPFFVASPIFLKGAICQWLLYIYYHERMSVRTCSGVIFQHGEEHSPHHRYQLYSQLCLPSHKISSALRL